MERTEALAWIACGGDGVARAVAAALTEVTKCSVTV